MDTSTWPPSVVVAAAVLLAALMGLALQRGATCTVAAVAELVTEGRATRLLALLETSAWIAAGLLLMRQLGLVDVLGRLPAGHATGPWGLVGAGLLGIGAFVNGACVFGALARLGSGEWAYLATPLGFYAGCVLASQPLAPMAAQSLSTPAPLFAAPGWLAWLLPIAMAGALALRLAEGWRARRTAPGSAWSPHLATALIGLCFVALLLLAGAWAYTDVLTDLARRMAAGLPLRLALLVALFAGALAGGLLAGLWQARLPSAQALARCFGGGLLMGCGSLLIPGGNDGLVLLAMPLLWPFAWAAFAVVCAVVAACLLARRAAAG